MELDQKCAVYDSRLPGSLLTKWYHHYTLFPAFCMESRGWVLRTQRAAAGESAGGEAALSRLALRTGGGECRNASTPSWAHRPKAATPKSSKLQTKRYKATKDICFAFVRRFCATGATLCAICSGH